MSHYDWRCQVCGEVAEVERAMADSGLGPSVNEAACQCGVEHYTKKLGMPSVPFEHLRDQGVFHRTHFKKDIDSGWK